MTQPPDERDPLAPDPGEAVGEPPTAEPAPSDAPTQAWTQETAPAEGGTTPDPTVGWGALPRTPEAVPTPPPPSPLISAEPAAAPGGASWTVPTLPTKQEVAPGLVWADTLSRFIAYVLDSIIVGVGASIIASILGFQPTTATSFGQAINAQSSIGVAVVTAVLGAAYFILFWSGGRRATLGQMLFKIQVGNAFDGQPLTTTQAVKRWIGLGQFLALFAVVPTFGLAALVQLVWSIVLLVTTTSSPTKQGLHDKFANSAVVRPAGAGNGLAMACLIVLLVLIILPIVALIFLGGQYLSRVGSSV